MTTLMLRCALALGLAGALALAAMDSADAARFQAEWTPVSRPENAKPVATPDQVRGRLFAERAPRKRAAWKRPRPPVLVEQPYVPYVREPGCVTMYDSSRSALPDHMNPACENAFRRLYPPR